jgi:hypothetical protein
MGGQWLMQPESLSHQKQIEKIFLDPQPLDKNFLDNFNTVIPAYVDLGRWFYSSSGNYPTTVNGYMQMKSLKMFSSGDYEVLVDYDNRGSSTAHRRIPSKYVANRRAMIFGRNENTTLGIRNKGDKGLSIDTILIEGNLIKRSKG